MCLDMRAEFNGLELGDCRRARRVKRIVQRLSARPDQSFPAAMADRAETEAFYRLIESDQVSFEALTEPHRRETAARSAAHPVVIVAHDTTDFTYKGDEREGLGRVSTSTDKRQGFYGHFSLVLSGDGRREPLGVIAVERWARTEPGVSKRRRAGELSIAEVRQLPRESGRWGRGIEQAEAQLSGAGISPIHVMDSEADDYALMNQLIEKNRRFVIRGYHNRKLAQPTFETQSIQQFVAKTPIAFEVYTAISKRKVKMFDDRKRQQKRSARIARLAFSAATVRLKRPSHVEKELPAELELNVVHLRELDAPEGAEPIDWTLYTSEPIGSDDHISKIVDYYRARWVIEEFFKALKTGCEFEKRQLESFHTLENALALFIPIAWGLLRLRTIARDYPDEPATVILQPIEITVLQRLELIDSKSKPTARQVLLAVAKLGGFLKHNGEPGWLILGRGYQELATLTAGFQLALRIRDQS